MRADRRPSATGNPRGRGTYNPACDVCARKKVKCDGNKPVCQPCQTQGRENECAWTKNPVRKPRTEAYVEAMHKQAENLRKYLTEFCRYADYLESLLDECYQYQQPRSTDFRASRPSDSDGLLGQTEVALDQDFDFSMAGDDLDDGNDPSVMAICIPPQSLEVEPFTQPSRFPALAENPEDTYVLFVEGVQPNHCNPNLEWSRNLPTTVPLDRPSHDRALDLLFKFFTSWCLRIVPALFLRDMYRALSTPRDKTPPKTPHYSPMLHNALVALALAYLDEPKLRDLKTRRYYANTAKSFIEDECRSPNLSVVHALSILGSFHSTQGEQTLGYMYFGMSARIGQALGLNVDCAEWVKEGILDEAERLDRHWVNWTSFTQDVCWSLYVGRDFCVAEPIPSKPASMAHIDPEFDSMSWFYPPAGIPSQPNNLTKTFEATCRLLMIARRIQMDVINGLNKARSRPAALDALISHIDVQLNNWKSSLDAELEINPRSQPTATPHKLMLHLAYWWLSIILHRPFFHRKSRPIHSMDSEIDHVKLCRRAAEHIMDLLSTWRTLYRLRYCPMTLVQTVFSAGTVYLLTARHASSGIRTAQKELRHSLDQSMLVLQYLQEIGLSWKGATTIEGTLRVLMDEQVRPLLDRKTISTAGLSVPIDNDDDGEGNGAILSRSSSRSSLTLKRSSITKMKPYQVPHPRIISSVSSQSSLSTSPKHILTPATATTQVSPTQAIPSDSPTITISSAHEGSSTHVARSAPIAIPSQRSASSSSSPSSFSDRWGFQPSPDSNFMFPTSFLTSFAQRDFRGSSLPSSNAIDDPFSSNGDASSNTEDIGHVFGGQSSFLAHNFQLSSSHSPGSHYAGEFIGMLGGQTLPETPFVGAFSEGDNLSPHFLDSLQAPLETGYPPRQSPSSSLGELVPSSSPGERLSERDNRNPHFSNSLQNPFGTSFVHRESSSPSLGEPVLGRSASHGDDSMELDSIMWE